MSLLGSRGRQGKRGEAGPRGEQGEQGEHGPPHDPLSGPETSRYVNGPTDKVMKWLKLHPWSVLAIIVFACLVGLGTVFQNAAREAHVRTDQICFLFETAHKENVRQLDKTYDFLLKTSAKERKSALVVAVLADLPHTESQARRDLRPGDPSHDFCDEPGVGLPEPDPMIPDRPAAVNEMLHPPPPGA